jgi:PIN domain nuclease of toxin-antitoxin system
VAITEGKGNSRLLLDTHAWIWWIDGSQELPARARQVVHAAYTERRLWVSSISAWEVALLVQRGRLTLRFPVREWIARCESLHGLQFLPVDNAISVRSVELPGLHADPADRLIVASAEHLRATLVTKDERLRAYAGVDTRWD